MNQLHLTMEALGDAIVFGESPHTHNLLSPFVKGFAQGPEWFEGALFELLNHVEQHRDKRLASPTR